MEKIEIFLKFIFRNKQIFEKSQIKSMINAVFKTLKLITF